MNKKVAILIVAGFSASMALALFTGYFLLAQLRHASERLDNFELMTRNIAQTTRRLTADYLTQGDDVSAFLLDTTDTFLLDRKIRSDSLSAIHLGRAMTATTSEDLKQLLSSLREFDQNVTDSLENYIMALAQKDPKRARDVYLTTYMAARRENLKMVRRAARLASSEVNAALDQSREDSDRASRLAWMALGGFALLGVALGTGVTIAARSLLTRINDSNEHLAAIVTSSNDAIYSRDVNGCITSWNAGARRMFGYREEEVIGLTSDILSQDGSSEEFGRLIDGILRGDGMEHRETKRRTKDGRLLDVALTASPLRDSAGKIIGVSTIARDITEQRTLRAKLEEAVSERQSELKRFAGMIQRVQEEDHRHTARELHDDLGQHLSAMRMTVEETLEHLGSDRSSDLERLQSVKSQIDELIAEIRRLSAHLRPIALDNFGLLTSLKLLARDVERASKFTVAFEARGDAQKRFDPQLEIGLYRIAQEALNNVAKHSQATAARLAFTRSNGTLRLEIGDNGVGFDGPVNRRESAEGNGFGLLSMRERTELMGGRFEIRTVPREGTTVIVEIPVPKENA